MPNQMTYILTWQDGEAIGSLLAIDEGSGQRQPCGFVRLDDPFLKLLPCHVSTVISEAGLCRVEFTVSAPALVDVRRRVA